LLDLLYELLLELALHLVGWILVWLGKLVCVVFLGCVCGFAWFVRSVKDLVMRTKMSGI
jgi:hypothetical protein